MAPTLATSDSIQLHLCEKIFPKIVGHGMGLRRWNGTPEATSENVWALVLLTLSKNVLNVRVGF